MNMQNRLGQALGQVAESQLSVDAAGTGLILPGPRGLAKPLLIMEPARLWFLSAVVVYGIGMLYSIFIWRRGFQQQNWVPFVLLAVAFAFHTAALVSRGFSLNHCPVNNLYEATAFVLWTISLGSLVFGLWPRLRFLGVFTRRSCFVWGVCDDAGPRSGVRRQAAVHQRLVEPARCVDHARLRLVWVKRRRWQHVSNPGTQPETAPCQRPVQSPAPIQRLEKLITYALIAGLILLTAGLAIGGVYLELPEGTSFWRDSKVVWSLLVWLFYAALLLAHLRFDQRGRRYAWLAIIAFCFVILTFWGTNLLSGIHNPTP